MFLGIISGKIGDSVGYKVANSNNKVVQGWRPYRSDVANPKTEPQAIQRLKLAPAVNFYRQLSRILDNAWQGQRYGNESRQHFMSLAMKQSTGIPFIVKGDKRFYPGEYPVAEGSLVRQSVTAISANLLTTSITSPGVTGTWGEFSQGLINRNFGIQNGDKLTFIFAGQNSLGDYVPAYSYVILDTSNGTAAADVIASSNLSMSGEAGADLQVGVINAVSGIVAGAVILSRLDQSTSTPKWLRSNSTMFCSDTYKELMMGTAAYQAAVSSYTSQENINSDWYLNAGITGGAAYYGPGGNSGSNLTVVSISNVSVQWSESNISDGAIAVMSDGSHRAFRTNTTPSKVMQYREGALVAYAYAATDAILAKIQVADPLVTGWIVSNEYSESGTIIEEP